MPTWVLVTLEHEDQPKQTKALKTKRGKLLKGFKNVGYNCVWRDFR